MSKMRFDKLIGEGIHVTVRLVPRTFEELLVLLVGALIMDCGHQIARLGTKLVNVLWCNAPSVWDLFFY